TARSAQVDHHGHESLSVGSGFAISPGNCPKALRSSSEFRRKFISLRRTGRKGRFCAFFQVLGGNVRERTFIDFRLTEGHSDRLDSVKGAIMATVISTKNNRKLMLTTAGVLVFGIAAYGLGRVYPPIGPSAGTVAPAQRYVSPQVGEGDVTLGDTSVPQLMQTDAFELMVHDPSFRALAASPGFQALASHPQVMAALMANPQAFAALAANPRAFAGVANAALNASSFASSAHNANAALMGVVASHPAAMQALASQPAALAAIAANPAAFASLAAFENAAKSSGDTRFASGSSGDTRFS